jgi:hypothetical protein
LEGKIEGEEVESERIGENRIRTSVNKYEREREKERER